MRTMPANEPLILPHGGYRHLKSFQVAELLYDVTVQFCDRYIDKRSRTHDQMVQAARSGTRNIAEGSQTSGTSKKSEIRLTDVARASLEELLLDYKKFLRDQGWDPLPPKHSALMRFKERRCKTLAEVRQWVAEEREIQEKTGMRARTSTDLHGPTRTGYTAHAPIPVRAGPCTSVLVRASPWVSVQRHQTAPCLPPCWRPMRHCRCSIWPACFWTASWRLWNRRSRRKAASPNGFIACVRRTAPPVLNDLARPQSPSVTGAVIGKPNGNGTPACTHGPTRTRTDQYGHRGLPRFWRHYRVRVGPCWSVNVRATPPDRPLPSAGVGAP
jgi:four helix bundle protein